MGSAKIESLMDFAALGVDIAIRCGGCRRIRYMTFDQMGAIFGMAARIHIVERKLRCSQCQHKGAKLAPVPKLEGRRGGGRE